MYSKMYIQWNIRLFLRRQNKILHKAYSMYLRHQCSYTNSTVSENTYFQFPFSLFSFMFHFLQQFNNIFCTHIATRHSVLFHLTGFLLKQTISHYSTMFLSVSLVNIYYNFQFKFMQSPNENFRSIRVHCANYNYEHGDVKATVVCCLWLYKCDPSQKN
jgi:hypothetical protein